MMLTYSRVDTPTDQDRNRSDALRHFYAVGVAHACRWVRSSDAPSANAMWPAPALASVHELESTAGGDHRRQAAFILQKDPDGCWFLDPWQVDAAGNVRSTSGRDPNASAQQASYDADACFIIEVG